MAVVNKTLKIEKNIDKILFNLLESAEKGRFMPELPEVETVKCGLAPAMEGRRIVSLEMSDKQLRFPYADDFRQVLQGARVERLSRRGKYIVCQLNADRALILHLGMSGSFHIVPKGQGWSMQKHDHLVFEMCDGGRIIYNDPRRFGFAEIVNGEAEDNYGPFMRMGPEPLGDKFDADYLRGALEAKKSPIKTALLNQEIVAGLGNIYVCEALYRSGIHPAREARKISKVCLVSLVGHIKDVLHEAIKSGGSSLKDHKGVDGTMGYFQHNFDVYDREGQICKHAACVQRGTPCVQRFIQAGRSTFYCSYTQT
jgi:formamidopyrimidine-DNA glycosylase